MLKKIPRNLIFSIIGVWLLFSSPYIFQGKTPFPSDYQTNFFSPWSSYPGFAGPVKNNAQPDIIGQIYPWRHFAIDELKNGRIPLWNPYSFSGTPHLANYQSAALFPLNIVFFLPIPFIDGWSLLVLLQPLLAGIGTYLFARKLKITSTGALISSLSFMFCGFLVTWMGYATLGYAILFLPWALYFVELYLSAKKKLFLICFSLTVAMSLLAGHFQTALYFLLTVFSYAVFNFIKKRNKDSLLVLVYLVAGVLMAMPQILPAIEFYLNSVRSALFLKVEAIPWSYLPTIVAPDIFGNPVTRNDWFGHYAEWNSYLGVIPFFLATQSLIFAKHKKVYFFAALGLISLLLAFDSPIQSILVNLKIPVLSTSASSRIIVLFSFSGAILAGFGFDALIRRINQKKDFAKSVLPVFLVWIFFVVTVAVLKLDNEKISIAVKNSIFPGIMSLIFIIVLLINFFLKSKKKVVVISAMLLVLTGFEMLRFASKWQSFSDKKKAYVDVPVSSFYRNQNRYDRAVGMSGGEDAVYYNVPITSGYDPLYIEQYGKFMQYVSNGGKLKPERSVVVFPLRGLFTHQALDFLGIHLVVHKFSDGSFPWAFPFADYPDSKFSKIYDDGAYLVFRNNGSYDRAFIVGKSLDMGTDESNLTAMFRSDLKKVAFTRGSKTISTNSNGIANIIEYNSDRVVISTNTNGNALLVLTDNFYPGWKATVNGKNQQILKTDYTFRGVMVPKGESIVIFSYMPQSFLLGFYLLLGAVMVIICDITLSYIKKHD